MGEEGSVDLDHAESLQGGLVAGAWHGSCLLRVTPPKKGEAVSGPREKDRVVSVDEGGKVSIAPRQDGADAPALTLVASATVLSDILHLRYDPVTALMGGALMTSSMPDLLAFALAFTFPSSPFSAVFWGGKATEVRGGGASPQPTPHNTPQSATPHSNQPSPRDAAPPLPKEAAKYNFPMGAFAAVPWHHAAVRAFETSPSTSAADFALVISFIPVAFRGADWTGRVLLTFTEANSALHTNVVDGRVFVDVEVLGDHAAARVLPHPPSPSDHWFCTIEGAAEALVDVLQGKTNAVGAHKAGKLVVSDENALKDVAGAFQFSTHEFQQHRAARAIAPAVSLQGPDAVVDSVRLLAQSFTGAPKHTTRMCQITITDYPAQSEVFILITEKKMTISEVEPIASIMFSMRCTQHQLLALVVDQLDASSLAIKGALPFSDLAGVEEFFSYFGNRPAAVGQWAKERFQASLGRPPSDSARVSSKPLAVRVTDAFNFLPHTLSRYHSSPFASSVCFRFRVTFGSEDQGSEVKRTVLIVEKDDGTLGMSVEHGWQDVEGIDVVCTLQTDALTFVDIVGGNLLPGTAHTHGKLNADNLNNFIELCKLLEFDGAKFAAFQHDQRVLPSVAGSGTLNNIDPVDAGTLKSKLRVGYVMDLDPPPPLPTPPPTPSPKQPQHEEEAVPVEEAVVVVEEEEEEVAEEEEEAQQEEEEAKEEDPPETPATERREREEQERMVRRQQLIARQRDRAAMVRDWREEAKMTLRGLSEFEMSVETEGFLAIKKSSGAWKLRYMIVKGRKLFCYGKGFLDGKIEFHWKADLPPESTVSTEIEVMDPEQAGLTGVLRRYVHKFTVSDTNKTREFAAISTDSAREWRDTIERAISQQSAFEMQGVEELVGSLSDVVSAVAVGAVLKDKKTLALSLPSFASPADVFAMLRPVLEGGDADKAAKAAEFLEIWIVDFPSDFSREGEALGREVADFASTLQAAGNTAVANTIVDALAVIDKPVPRERPMSMYRVPNPLMPTGKVTLLSVDAEEAARQLTLLDQEAMHRISPRELLGQAWAAEDADKRAPNVVACIKHFNRTMYQLATAIVIPPASGDRAAVIAKLVSVCQHLRGLNNFNGVKCVLGALSCACVSRMLTTWELVDVHVKGALESLQSDMSGERGHTRYRKILYASIPPALPFLGLLLTDLSFIEEGHATTMEDGAKVNFTKQKYMFNIVEDFQYYADMPYNLRPVPSVRSMLQELHHKPEDQLMLLSELREPRPSSRKSSSSIRV